MSPTDLVFDARYVALKDAVFSRNQSIEPAVCANGQDLLGGEFRCSASLASVVRAVPSAVRLVLFGCPPSQVIDVVMAKVAVVVAALMAIRGGANEGEQNESMNLVHRCLIGLPQKDVASKSLLVLRWLLQHAGARVSDIPVAGNIVETFKADNGFPYFHGDHYPTQGDMGEAK